MTRLARSLWAGSLAAILTACGGGGGGGDPEVSGPITVSGQVIKGPVQTATVILYSVQPNGVRTQLAQTTTAQDGSYAFRTVPPAGAVLMVMATGGSYVDEATAATVGLSTPLRAIDVWSAPNRTISPTPYSEVSVRSIEQSTAKDWSPAAVQAANLRVADWLGVPALIDFRHANLLASADWSGFKESDLSMSLFTGAFSTFHRRLDRIAATSLPVALGSLYQLAIVDRNDDLLFPAFVGALAEFVDLTALAADNKRAVKSVLLLGSEIPLPEVALQQALPRGVSNGGATASMTNDAFNLVGYTGARTFFNRRGALVGYTLGATSPDWQVAYTASVAELYGDGEVGIGRWNGGPVAVAKRSGEDFDPIAISMLPYDAFHYAVASAAYALPVCGLRRLALVAHTTPTLMSVSVGASRLITGLTVDSVVGLQYLGDTYLGADIGVRLPDNTVVRFRTPGGADAPWATPFPIGTGELVIEPVAPAGMLASFNLRMVIQTSGNGARKVAMRLQIGASDATESVAVFAAPEGSPDPSGCTVSGSAGTGISTRPADGDQFIFLAIGNDNTYRGAPVPATFEPSGALKSVLGPTVSSPAFDLAGNADASIGRVMATGTLANTGANITQSVPYAAVRPDAIVPTSGSVTYDLIASTAVVVQRGGNGSAVPPGQVTSATLQIRYGEYPLGTPSPFYGTPMLTVAGSVAGLPFILTGDPANPSTPRTGRSLGPVFSGDTFEGAVAAPTGEYAAVRFTASVGSTPVNGTLLFRRRGG